jgi:hypothetical protein
MRTAGRHPGVRSRPVCDREQLPVLVPGSSRPPDPLAICDVTRIVTTSEGAATRCGCRLLAEANAVIVGFGGSGASQRRSAAPRARRRRPGRLAGALR